MDIVLIGAGGHGKVVLDIVQCQGKHRPIGFLDADARLHGTRIGGVEVLGGLNLLHKLRSKARGAIVAIGDNRVRQQCAAEARSAGFELATAIHPAAVVAGSATLGSNVVVAAGAIVCTDATVGDSTIINTGASVDHECFLGEAVHVAPGARLAGRVRVEKGAFIGLGAAVIQCLTIGPRAVVGAGAVVIRDVPPAATVVGCPARIVRRSN